jgi:hypothetical protein
MKEKQKISASEQTPLLASNNDLTRPGSTERLARWCVEMPTPWSFFCQSGRQRDLDERIAQRNPSIFKQSPIITFRADSRGPNGPGLNDNIFSRGFDAYSLSRLINRSCDDSFACIFDWLCCMPVTLLCCLCSYTSEGTSGLLGAYVSPGDCLGQNRIRGQFDTGGGAISFAKTYYDAKPYYGGSKDYWTYMVYLPEHVDISAYCEALIKEGREKQPIVDELGGAHNVGEIIPNGPQQVSANHIIAAVQHVRDDLKMHGGGYFYQTEKIGRIAINRDFIFYEQLKKYIGQISESGEIEASNENVNALIIAVNNWRVAHEENTQTSPVSMHI